MKGLITTLILNSIRKGKTLKVVQRLLRIKHKINVTLDALKKRKSNLR